MACPGAISLLEKARLVNRKATKAAIKLPHNFSEHKKQFLHMITTVVQTHHIPEELVINIDETPLRIISIDKWTLEKEGTKQVPVVGFDDKREKPLGHTSVNESIH